MPLPGRASFRALTANPHWATLALAVGITTVAALVAATIWVIQASRDTVLRQAEQQERNIALVIRDEIARAMNMVDESLQSTIRGLAYPGIKTMESSLQKAILFNSAGEASTSATIIADQTGHVAYQSDRLSPISFNFAGRSQFEALKRADIGLTFSPPTRSLIDDAWIVGVARRINNKDGSFGGAALKRIPLSFFRDMFEKLDIGQNGIITLANTNGVLIARRPFRVADVGRDLSRTAPLLQAAKASSGAVKGIGIDAVERLYYVEQVGDYPFVVIVGLPIQDIYGDWLHKTIIICSVLGSLIVIGVLLSLLLLREFSRRGQAEFVARDNEKRVQKLIDSVTDHSIYYLDSEGYVVSWNKTSQDLKGYSTSEILGVHFKAFFTQEACAIGEPAHLLGLAKERGRVEHRALRVRKDGSQFWGRIALTAICDEAGTLTGYVAVVRDLTSTQVEEAQRAIMIEAAPTGMLIVDERGIITLINTQAEQIFGYRSETLVGQPAELLVPALFKTVQSAGPAADAERHVNQLPSDGQFDGLRSDGSVVPVEVMLRPVRTPIGSISVVSIIDSTDRLRRAADEAREREAVAEANARLEKLTQHLSRSRDVAKQANEAKSRFLTSVTHELRTPLNGILGYAQLLRLQGGLTANQAANVEAMEEAGKHLLGMINAVLDLSQIETDRIEMHSADIEVQPLVDACLNLVAPSAVAKGLSLSQTTAPSAPSSIVGDAIRLRQVLVNLLGNAIKFTAEGSVQVRLLKAERHNGLRLEVADTGPGIAAEHHEKLFREFERLGYEGNIVQEGSGLGLAITARLVARMDGRLGYADNPAGGSIFWVELPQTSGPRDAETKTVTDNGAEPANKSVRILVVDDVAMNRDIATAFLRLGGHEVVSVESGQAAIEAVKGDNFGLVLMDVRMPGMDGLEATRLIRKLGSRAARIPIVAMTAQAFSEQIEQCRQAGMDGHLAKPFQYDALLKAVASATTERTRPADPEPSTSKPPSPPPQPPVIDEAAYNATAPLLGPETLKRHLGALIERSERLVIQLRGPDMMANLTTLADDAHALGGAAGTIGFPHLAETARMFERSVGLDAPEIAGLADLLTDALESTLLKMKQLLSTPNPDDLELADRVQSGLERP